MRKSSIITVTAAVLAVLSLAALATPTHAQGTTGRVVTEAIDVAEQKAAALLGKKSATTAGADGESTSRAIGTRFTEALARGEVDVLRNSLVKNALKKFTGKTDEPLLAVLRAKAAAADKKYEWDPIIARIEKDFAGDEAATNFAVLAALVKARKPIGSTSIDEISYVLLHKAEKTPLNAEERAFIVTTTRDIKGAPPALIRYEGRYMTPELKAVLVKADEQVARYRALAAKWPKTAAFPWKAEVAQLRAAFKIPPGVDKSMMNAVDTPDVMLQELTKMEAAGVQARTALHRLVDEAATVRASLLDSFETSVAARRMEPFGNTYVNNVEKSIPNAATRLDNIAKKFAAWASGTEKNVPQYAKNGFGYLEFVDMFNKWAAKNEAKLRNGGAVWDAAYHRLHNDAIQAYVRKGCNSGECAQSLQTLVKARQAMEAAEASAATKFWDVNHKTMRDVLVQEANAAADNFVKKYPILAGVEYSGLWGTTRYKVPNSMTGQVSSVATAPQWVPRDLQSTYASSIDNWAEIQP